MLTKEMKDSGVEWIGNIPVDWKVIKLKRNMNFINGFAFKSAEFTSNKKDTSVITISSFNNQGISSDKISYSKEVVKEKHQYLVKNNDILFAMSGGTVGKNLYIDSIEGEYYINQRVGIVRSNINKFIYYCINTEGFSEYVKLLSTGSAQPNISSRDIGDFIISIPEEEKIPKIVNELDVKVGLVNNIIYDTKQSIKELERYKQSTITEVVTKGLNPEVEMTESGIKWMGSTPASWKIVKINQLFSIKKNIANQTGYDVLSVTQRGLRVRDITKNEGQMAADYSKYQIVEPNDFVMNHMDLLTGWIDIATQVGVTSPDYRVFYNKQTDLVFNDYYLYIFQACYFNKIFYGLGQGVSNVGRWRLQTNKFLNFYLPLPTIEEQQKIVSYLNEQIKRIDALIQDKEKVMEELEQYKKSLIYEYVTGKKEV